MWLDVLPPMEANMKSHISDDLEVIRNIYLDVCESCSTEVSNRDLLTIRSRVKTQGFSFLTITLPNFCSDFEKCLDQKFIDSKCFRFFKKHRAIPAFLQGLLSQVFDLETGRINDDKIINSPDNFARLVAGIRQLCLAFKKIKLPCTPYREYKVLENFIATERSLEMFSLPREDIEAFRLASFMVWNRILRTIRPLDATPRHGPGATSERLSGNGKYSWKYWHDRLEPYFPLCGSAYSPSIGEFAEPSEELKTVTVLAEEEELPVRIVLVPKTLKAPRVIAIEPCCMQYAQQGLRSLLYEAIESDDLTAGHVNFRDQSVNQSLAITSSNDGRLATIDLSDASDRVPLSLVKVMLESNQDFLGSVLACRSRYALLPSGVLFGPLMKFASMGSALCFPIEAMYFYTICVMALAEEAHLPMSRSTVEIVSRDIYIYGDDIIVPVAAVDTVRDYLKKYNCEVNDRKSFWNGNFRESCGVDAYLGRDVTPTYIRTVQPSNRRQSSELLSWCSTANHFVRRGYLRTSQHLFRMIERYLGPLPSLPQDSQGIGRNHPWPVIPRKRFNRSLQCLEIRVWIPSPVYRIDKLEGFAALTKSLLILDHLKDDLSPRDPLHLERSARYRVVALKLGWIPAP
jgi:hypothetical protein